MSLTLPRDWWGYHWSPPRPLSIAELLRARTLDPELAALLWLLLEARIPLIVAADPPLAGKSTTLTALLDFLPPQARPIVLRGRYETFDWLPEAAELGWLAEPDRRGTQPAAAAVARGASPAGPGDGAGEGIHAASGYLLVSELSDHLPGYTWGMQARLAVRAAGRGYGLAATIHADSLAAVLAQLEAPPVGLRPDELTALGVVLVLRMFRPDGTLLTAGHGSADSEIAPLERGVTRRIVAAHYVRPLERDAGGHVQRRPPAVLATWDPVADALEHFAWGVVPELAARTGRSPGDFEREQKARADLLAGLVERAVFRRDDVAGALDAYRRGPSERGAAIPRPALRTERTAFASPPLSLPSEPS